MNFSLVILCTSHLTLPTSSFFYDAIKKKKKYTNSLTRAALNPILMWCFSVYTQHTHTHTHTHIRTQFISLAPSSPSHIQRDPPLPPNHPIPPPSPPSHPPKKSGRIQTRRSLPHIARYYVQNPERPGHGNLTKQRPLSPAYSA